MKTRTGAITAGVGILFILVVAALSAAWITMYDGNYGADANPTKIRVGYFPVVGHAIPIIGIEKGVFQEHLSDGVSLETKVFDSGPQVVESMFAGSIDIAYAGPGPAINAFLNSEEKNRIRILATAASGGTSFVAHPDILRDNAEFDFAHKKIAAPQIGNTQDVSLRSYLHGVGLQPADRGGNVIIYNIPNPDIVTLFVKGEIDGAWVSEPWATILVDEYGGHRLFYEEELWPGGEFATVLLIANTRYVEDNPDVMDAWMQAHHKVVKVINSDVDAAGMVFNDFLLGHFGQNLDLATVQTAMHNTKVTSEPLTGTVHEFADRADRLGYMGRGSYDLSGLYYNFEYADTVGTDGTNAGAAGIGAGGSGGGDHTGNTGYNDDTSYNDDHGYDAGDDLTKTRDGAVVSWPS